MFLFEDHAIDLGAKTSPYVSHDVLSGLLRRYFSAVALEIPLVLRRLYEARVVARTCLPIDWWNSARNSVSVNGFPPGAARQRSERLQNGEEVGCHAAWIRTCTCDCNSLYQGGRFQTLPYHSIDPTCRLSCTLAKRLEHRTPSNACRGDRCENLVLPPVEESLHVAVRV